MASAIASATRTARSLSRGSRRRTPPAGTEVAATGRTIPRARALRRKAGVRDCAAARLLFPGGCSELASAKATSESRRSRRAGAGRMIAFAAPERRTRRRACLRNATNGIARSRGWCTTPAVTTSIRSAAPTMRSRRCSAPPTRSRKAANLRSCRRGAPPQGAHGPVASSACAVPPRRRSTSCSKPARELSPRRRHCSSHVQISPGRSE